MNILGNFVLFNTYKRLFTLNKQHLLHMNIAIMCCIDSKFEELVLEWL